MRRARVLVVEDSRTMRELIATLLRDIGVGTVDEADGGWSALKKLRRSRYDLIFSDLEMEPMSGLELLIAIRDDPALRQIPFVMLTSHAESAAVRAAQEAGADNYMVKPFCLETLHRKVDALLCQHA